MGTHTCFRHL
jgi:hypothetical protein